MIIGSIGLILVLAAGLVMAEKPQPQTLERAVLKIDRLSCGGCFSSINAGLASLEGYSGMGANLFRKRVAIDFTPPLTAEKISQTLLDVGYPGTLETVYPISEKESFAYLESRRTGPASSGGSCCSGGSPLADNRTNEQGSTGRIAPNGGSCCTLPSVPESTEDL